LDQRLAVPEVPQLDLDEGAEVAGRAVLRIHVEVRLAVDLDDLAFADVVGCGHDDKIDSGGWFES
jgi:hypothetical protein